MSALAAALAATAFAQQPELLLKDASLLSAPKSLKVVPHRKPARLSRRSWRSGEDSACIPPITRHGGKFWAIWSGREDEDSSTN